MCSVFMPWVMFEFVFLLSKPLCKGQMRCHCFLPEQPWDLSPARVSMQGASSSVSWGLYGDDQGHALQTELLVRVCRWVKPGSGTKTGLRYLDLHGNTDEVCGIDHNSHKLSVSVVSFLPHHASKFSSTESQDILIHPCFSSAACRELAQPCHEGWGYQHRLHHQCIHSWERLLSLHGEYRDLGASRFLS